MSSTTPLKSTIKYVTAPPTKPTDPNMGSAVETYKGSGNYYLSFGGIPKADWSGIAVGNDSIVSDLCYRSLDPGQSQKSVQYRTRPLKIKLVGKKNLKEFQEEVWKHLTKYGLDTLAYLPDPMDKTKVLNVVEHHAKFTGDTEEAFKLAQEFKDKFDDWDKKHDNECKTFLLDSLDSELYKGFKPFCQQQMSFAGTWLCLITYILTTNSTTFDKLKERIRGLHPKYFPGQNIELMSAEYIKLSDELENAGFFENSLLLNMVNGFLNAEVDNKMTFHFQMNSLCKRVEEVQRKTTFMTKMDQDKVYQRERLTCRDICFIAIKEYKSLLSNNYWEPAKLPKDRNTPAYVNNMTVQEIMNLMANMPTSNGQQGQNGSATIRCGLCDEPGHTEKNCPKLKKKTASQIRRHAKLQQWKLVPPKKNESHSKVINGRTYYWCAKCMNWTPTHKTETHRGLAYYNNKKKGNKNNAESNLAAWTPEAWMVETNVNDISDNTSNNDGMKLLVYIYFVITLPILLGTVAPQYSIQLGAITNLAMTEVMSYITMMFKNGPSYMMNLLINQSHLFAPILWIATGFFISKLYRSSHQPFNPVIDLHQTPRSIRRSQQRAKDKVVYKHKSARDNNLNRNYPLKLRNENKFNRRKDTPTVEDRELLRAIEAMKEESNEGLRSSYHGHSRDDEYVQVSCLKVTPSEKNWRKCNQYSKNKHFKERSHSNEKNWHRNSKRKTSLRPDFYETRSTRFAHANTKPKRIWTQSKKNYLKSSSFFEQRGRQKFEMYGRKYSEPKLVSESKSRKIKYKPVGIPNHRDMPNKNLTVGQFSRLKRHVNTILLTGAQFDQKVKSMARRISNISPSGFEINMGTSGGHKVVWDSGASICVTPSREDFVQYQKKTDIELVKGIGGSKSKVVGQGIVKWSVHDVNGGLRTLELQAYHIPLCRTRLISTSSLLKAYQGETIKIDSSRLTLSGIKGNTNRNSVIVDYHPGTNLPTSNIYTSWKETNSTRSLCYAVTTVSEENQNLTEAQKELLRWHQRLGHLEFKKIQHLMRTGVLSHTEATRSLHTAASKLREVPKCAACLFGKQTVRSSPGKRSIIIRDRAGALRAGNLHPGSEISVDHFVSSVRGRLFTGYNKGDITNRYVGGCIFVDHASSYIHVEMQSSLSSHETLRGKLAFERLCRDYGVIPHTYMSDNGRAFTSRDFVEHLSSYKQVSKFAGVGAHHHNAQAERAIRTIMSIARTMMIHSATHWPDVANSELWPMAVKQACFLYNHVPHHTTGLSPSDIFTRTRWPQRKFHDLHVWGCPVYVLEKELQDGKKIPKWKPRSRRSVYMGISNLHASSVPLVLNTSTGAITPQFHIVFDDWFATVTSQAEELPDFSSKEWYKMFGESTYQYKVDDDDEEEAEGTNISDMIDTLKNDLLKQRVGDRQDVLLPSKQLNVEEPDSKPSFKDKAETVDGQNDKLSTSQEEAQDIIQPIEKEAEDDNKGLEIEEISRSPPIESKPKKKFSPEIVKSDRSLRSSLRPKRAKSEVKRFTYDSLGTGYKDDTGTYLLDFDYENQQCHIVTPKFDHYVLLASKKEADPDLFSYEQAMSGEHRTEWIKAAIEEIKMLESLDCWEEIPTDQATEKILPGTWVFKIKRAPDGSFKKFKARYCIRGDLQEGDFDTFAPVVHFSSVRLFLAWSLMFNWYTCSIDFSSAFIQAYLESPAFIHLPRGFRSRQHEKTCLRLKRSIYGLSTAPRLWFKHLWTALEKLGLKQSKHDPCLLFRKDLIIICYVDDLGIQAPNKEIVDKLIQQLRNLGFTLTMEGSFSEYLGIHYDWKDSDTLEMTQQGLIQKIIDATGMGECNPNRTPSTKEGLSSDENGEPMTDSWNYRSVIGMMLYLSTNTRPDISFAVSQVARFSHKPKQSHATAVKMIVRYLSGTKDKGVIYKRPKAFSLECYVDADYAGLYNREPPENPISVKSRTGFIISVAGCYVMCKSQLQSTIALSTSEAEYGALSQGMRTIIPIRETLVELINEVKAVDKKGNYPFGTNEELKKFPTVIYEDNSTALSLAKKQKVTSRTKHWCVKFHFFWSYVNDKDKNTTCVKVATDKQKADYLTKGLTKDKFENCRNLNQGW